jgi:hypothetical protein
MDTSYYPDVFPRIAKKLCECSCSIRDLAEAFATDEDQIKEWQKEHAEFADACDEGCAAARERLLNPILENITSCKREKIVNIGGTPARIFVEEPRIDVAAAVRMFIYFEQNQPRAIPESPLAALARELNGTAIRPKDTDESGID